MLLSLFCLIVASAMLVFPIPALAGEKYGTFTPVGEMNIPRSYHTATLLPNGKVLIAGGIRGFRDVLDSAELYDPALHKFTLTEKMLSVRAGHTATLLRDGKVLIAGGFRSGEALASAELYDPVSGKFSSTGTMVEPRQWPTATLLATGRVLITGGSSNQTGITPTAELYDPAAREFVATGNMTVARVLHFATALNNGDVLIVGGMTGASPDPILIAGRNYLGGAELFDPGQGRFSLVAGTGSNGSAMLLASEKVLIAGGIEGRVVLSDARLYDPVKQAFLATGGMTSARFRYDATLLSDGQVLVTGGVKNIRWPLPVVATAELYDPDRGAFVALPDMTTPRIGHTATLLPDGEVLIAGGFRGSLTGLSAAELYRPASIVKHASAKVGAIDAIPAADPNREIHTAGGGENKVWEYEAR